MCDPISLSVATVASGAFTAYNQYQAGAAESKQYQYEGDVARQEGKLALKRGETQSNLVQDAAKDESLRHAQDTAKLSASQKAALAANGIDLGSVTAQDITLDTSNRAAMDEAAIRHNADLKSWEITQEAQNENWQSNVLADQYGYAAKNAKATARRQAFSTILGTATQVGTGLGGGAFAPKSQSVGQGVGLRPY